MGIGLYSQLGKRYQGFVTLLAKSYTLYGALSAHISCLYRQ